MPRPRRGQPQGPIEAYDHFGQERLNNPPVGLVSPDTDRDAGRRIYDYEPHLDHQTGLLISELPSEKFAIRYV